MSNDDDIRDAYFIPAEDLTGDLQLSLASGAYLDAGQPLKTTLADLGDYIDLGSGPFQFSQSVDINPSYHLSRWANGNTQKVVIIGDSTATDDPAPNYAVDGTQTIWGALTAEITRQNLRCKFTFVNRGISGANWAWPLETGTEIADPNLPDWFTDLSLRWIDYVKVEMPDTVFVLLGTNATSANTALYIGDVMAEMASWTKVPDIVVITNKTANAGFGGQFLVDQEYYKATSAFLRTFSRTNGNGYTGFPQLKFGLLDPGRHYNARAFGKDFAYQYMKRKDSAIRNGLVLTGPLPTATTIADTTDGDLRMQVVFLDAGGTAMFNVCDTPGFYVNISKQTSNRLHFSLTSDGIWVTRYQTTGSDFAPAVLGINYSPPVGNVTMLITLKSEVVQVTLNDTMVLNTAVPRFICASTIAIGSSLAPAGSMVFNVTQFYEGIGAPAAQTVNPSTAFGMGGGPEAGNDINHPSSSTNALIDWQVIAATNWGVPAAAATEEDDDVQLYVAPTIVGNGADTTVDVIQQFTLNGSQLRNIGDCITLDLGGQIASSADTKNIWVRWGDPAGLILWSTTGNGGSLCQWSTMVTITKQSNNVQQCKSQGSVSSVNYINGTTTGQAGLEDDIPITIYVQGQNFDTATANSVTCRMFRVSYVKAPGT